MRRAFLAAILLAGGAAALAQAPPAPKPETRSSRTGSSAGEQLYLEHCAMCHAPNGMGTGLLARRGGGEALLERRQGLTANFIQLAARQGIGNMPPVPRGEVSDADMKAIADYLVAAAAKAPAP